jgi:hypothetical protein
MARVALAPRSDQYSPVAGTTAWRDRHAPERLPPGEGLADVDPLSGKRLYLTETVPAGPRALAEAKKVRTRLITQIGERRNPRTHATVEQLMDRYLDVLDVEQTTRARYEAAIRLHVRPLLGAVPLAKLTGETIDAFNTILRRCRDHCNGRPFIEHVSDDEPHECTGRCRPHVCRPLSPAASERSTNTMTGGRPHQGSVTARRGSS